MKRFMGHLMHSDMSQNHLEYYINERVEQGRGGCGLDVGSRGSQLAQHDSERLGSRCISPYRDVYLLLVPLSLALLFCQFKGIRHSHTARC